MSKPQPLHFPQFSRAVGNRAWMPLEERSPTQPDEVPKLEQPILIVFRSSSDAILADLLMREKISHGMLNTFLKILKLPAFKQDEITFDQAADLDEYISEQRRKQQASRASRLTSDASIGGGSVPILVVDLVAGHLSEILLEIAQSEIYTYGPRHAPSTTTRFELKKTLRSMRESLNAMSLVHRHWTSLAQKALRECFVDRDGLSVTDILQSPFFGSSLRILSTTSFRYGSGQSPGHDLYEEERRLTCAVTKRLPNLRSLQFVHYSQRFTPCEILQLANLPLRKLTLGRLLCRETVNNFLCAISQMRYLESLSFSLMITSDSTAPRSRNQAILPQYPPRSLKCLVLSDIYPTDFDFGVLQWFLTPLENEDYYLTSLSCFVRWPGYDDKDYMENTDSYRNNRSRMSSILVPSLPSLEYLSMCWQDGELDEYQSEVDFWMSKADSLRHLVLSHPFISPFTCPTTLEILEFCYKCNSSLIVEAIKGVVRYSHRDLVGLRLVLPEGVPRAIRTQLLQICGENKIQLEIRRI